MDDNTPKDKYIFEYKFKVRDYELDAEGIVNNANYLHYLEVTRHEFCEANGISFVQMQERGIVPVLRRVEIDYINSLVAGDEVISKLNLVREGARFIFVQDLFRESDMTQVSHAKVTCVTLEQGRLSKGDKLASYFTKFI